MVAVAVVVMTLALSYRVALGESGGSDDTITGDVIVGDGTTGLVLPRTDDAASSTTTVAPSTSTTTPGTTTSTVPPTTAAPTTTTTTAPPPAPTTTTTIAPTTTTSPAVASGDPGTGDLQARVEAALVSAVPSRWRSLVPTHFSIISGTTSWSYTNGVIEMGSYHASGDWSRLRALVAHEFGHQLAYRFGTGAYLGAPPAGWPVSGSTPVERWSDCVARAFTGYALGSHGQSACSGDSLSWTSAYLATGP